MHVINIHFEWTDMVALSGIALAVGRAIGGVSVLSSLGHVSVTIPLDVVFLSTALGLTGVIGLAVTGDADDPIEQLTAKVRRAIETDDPDLVVLNYANPDMVGHTGDFDAAVDAVEAVDAQLGRLLDAVADAGGHAIVTADHGNADDMGTPEDPHTAHTFNPVPVVYLTPDGDGGGAAIRDDGSLCDIAPTVLDLMGLDRPSEMTGESLLSE